MTHSNLLSVVDALRMTLATIENDTDFSPDDPAVKHLKIIILRRIAELEQHDIQTPTAASELMA